MSQPPPPPLAGFGANRAAVELSPEMKELAERVFE